MRFSFRVIRCALEPADNRKALRAAGRQKSHSLNGCIGAGNCNQTLHALHAWSTFMYAGRLFGKIRKLMFGTYILVVISTVLGSWLIVYSIHDLGLRT